MIKSDDLFFLPYITKSENNSLYARTTMHSMGVLLEGKKIIHLKNKDIEINKNQLFLLTQNNYYMSERTIEDFKYKSLLVYFNDKFIFDFINKYQIKINLKSETTVINYDYTKDILFKDSIDSFINYLDNKIDINLLKLKFEEILLHLIRLNNVNLLSFFNSILITSPNRIKYILESNIDLLQNLDDIRKITRLSESAVRKYIKKEYNQTPKVWLDTKRLEKATLLLKTTNKSISEVSIECGYSTVSWFISQFKKYYQQTPKDFRQNL